MAWSGEYRPGSRADPSRGSALPRPPSLARSLSRGLGNSPRPQPPGPPAGGRGLSISASCSSSLPAAASYPRLLPLPSSLTPSPSRCPFLLQSCFKA